MDLPGRPQAEVSERTWQASATLHPGSCTIVDWLTTAEADDTGSAENEHAEHSSDGGSDSEGSSDEGGGGYVSNSNAVPPAIANDPFFARLLKNAELYDSNTKKPNAKKRAIRRRAKDATEDDYDLEDPFIDDSEITFMDNHSLTKKQRKKRRKKNDGNNTETEGQAATETAAADTEDPNGKADSATGGTSTNNAKPALEGVASANGKNEPGATLLDDLDKYEEDDFFVYYGPLNELQSENEDEQFEKTDKKKRSRKRPEKKQPSKESAPAKRKSNGTAQPKGTDVAEALAAKKKADGKSQHRRSSSESGTSANIAQIPTNGRKSGARTSRKLESSKATSMIEQPAISGTAGSGTEDDAGQRRPPVPNHDRPAAASSAKNANGNKEGYPDPTLSEQDSPTRKHHFKRSGTPSTSGITTSSTAITPEDALAISEARESTPEIEAALEELIQATKSEAFENRQRFPSTLKPPLRQVCELSMARALDYDRSVLSLRTPEHKIFAWSTPMDIVGFTAGIYHRLAGVLPYNRATVRKIVSKLLGHDLLTWKERQLKQIEDGLKARIDEQIERGMGWIPVGARTGTKESEDGTAGGAQVRWHWTTISKHILYQYIVLTLSMNELRNHLGQGVGKDGAYREQQARKDAYAHLVNLWPGSTMVTYEISRAYSSRKSLVERQNKKTDGTTGPTKSEVSPTAGQRARSQSTLETTPVPQAQPEFVADSGGNAQILKTPEVSAAGAPGQSIHSTPVISRYDNGFAPSNHNMSPYLQNPVHSPQQQQQQQMASTTGAEYTHSSQRYDSLNQLPEPPMQVYDGGANGMPVHQHSPHRNPSAFDRQPDPFAHAGGYTHTGSAHISPYYGGGSEPIAQHEGRQLQFQPQPHQDQQDMGNGGNENASNEDGYKSPGSSRYSMSVHNLTSP
ncbi:hypothetical protein IW140_000657 [Coemansia sp. RSA 1813]|nr:hypothetical protein EV178_000837 [Coemansia sp. RSA 1646]KAJ1773836.1 hypothetical protein LPJ74_000380 [Coemansia sp. RSA 1843]KAJ2092458.1 hypothetical protein IW138_001220 [Coemansia sp. RSA 986]KAJ2217318.1 hypothetical protein EV179_000468 [Coemansia sp. RSA 487]KAJ2572542.1 hypothetical protein IW140_000657 [Coemansia sp. RSA 1813]